MSEEMAALHGDLREVRRALFGDLMRQETGLVKGMQRMERVMDDVARRQEELVKLVPLVEELKRNSDARMVREEEERRNRVSRAAWEVARVLLVLLFAAPVVVEDLRRLWLGLNPWMAPVVLAVLAGLFALVSILTRK